MCPHEQWDVIGGSFDSGDGIVYTAMRRLVQCHDCGTMVWDDELTDAQRAKIDDDATPKGFGTTNGDAPVYYDTLRSD